MSAIITIIHVLICLILIVAVLLQSGKAADLAGAFGGVGSQTAFGPRGTATILSKVTTICAALFMVTSMGLWMMSAKGAKSVVKGEPAAKPSAAATAPQSKTEEPAATPAQKPDETQAAPQPATATPQPPAAAAPKTEPTQKKEPASAPTNPN